MKEKEPIVLIGGGGHCASCIDVIESEKRFDIVGIIDRKEKIGSTLLGYPVIAGDEEIASLIQKYKNAFVTVGQIKSSALREKLINMALKSGAFIPTIISPRAYVSSHSRLGQGCIIMHDAVINANATIDDYCIINTKCLVEHDCRIGAFSHLATGAILNGEVTTGRHCFVGSQATIIQSLKIADYSIVGAGETIKKDLI